MSENPFKAEAEKSRRRTAIATATYEALLSTKRLRSHRLLSYRCPSRCLLLDVINLPQGVIFRSPPYKLSPSINAARSSEAGRAKNTRDGDNHWNGHTYFASECLNVSLNCDHVLQVVLEKVEIQADLDARHTEVVVLPTGERRTR